GNEWLSATELSIFGDPEVSAPAIHSCAQRLSMWPRVNVSERPALEKTIEWLQSLKTGQKLEPSELKRIRSALHREPSRIWHSCGHWVSINGTWEPVDRLKFRLTMQELTKFGDLTPTVKRKTADFRMLAEENTQIEPFVQFRNLSESVEFRVTSCEGDVATALPDWLDELAAGLCRIRFTSEEETQRIRDIGSRLRESQFRRFRRIEITPYVDGDPAGEPSSPKAIWANVQVYVADLPASRIHKELVDEISRPFGSVGITAAIAACVERERDFVTDYLTTEFTLDSETVPTSAQNPGLKPSSTPSSNGAPNPNDLPPEDEPAEDGEPESSDEGSEPNGEKSGGTDAGRSRGSSKPHEPSLMERYAHHRGFHWEPQAGRFTHRDGRWIGKDDQPFHWAEHRADGILSRRLWVCDQRLSRGIEVSHELWQTIKKEPEYTAIVSIGEDDKPIVLTGFQLIEQKGAGILAVYPARYRLLATNLTSLEQNL
ncbi:MAG: hypothetical protein ACOYKM_14350, partial [Caulobacterales bacterium]